VTQDQPYQRSRMLPHEPNHRATLDGEQLTRATLTTSPWIAESVKLLFAVCSGGPQHRGDGSNEVVDGVGFG